MDSSRLARWLRARTLCRGPLLRASLTDQADSKVWVDRKIIIAALAGAQLEGFQARRTEVLTPDLTKREGQNRGDLLAPAPAWGQEALQELMELLRG